LKRRRRERQGQSESEDSQESEGDYLEGSDSSEESSDDSSCGSGENNTASGIEQGTSDLEEDFGEGLLQPPAAVPNKDSETRSDSGDSHASNKNSSGEDTDNLSDGGASGDSGGSEKSKEADDSDTSGDSNTSNADSEEDRENIMGIVKLFDGSEHSRDEAILNVLELFKDPNMTKTLLRKTVSLVYSLLPKPNSFPPTYYFLMKHLDGIAPVLKPEKHFYCQKCQFYQGLTKLPICPVCVDNKADSFYMFSVHDIIKYLFEVRKLAKVLKHIPNQESFICDITDGAEYGKVWENLNKTDVDLTLLWNTDGVQLSESSNIDLWPIQLTICEIPPHLREYYLVVCAICVSASKPDLKTLLRPFALQMKEIYEKGGVKWTDPETGNERLSMVLAPVASLDALARADALNQHHHNGEYPCSRCERRGKNIRTRRKGNKRVFPPKNRPSRYRTAERMLKHAYKAKFKKAVKGMKGPSYVHVIPKFNAPKAMIAESLHNSFSGVTRLFVKTMFTDCNGPWYIKARMPEIDEFLLSVQLPKFISRSTRRIKEWRNFKAHEFMSWLFYLSLPALNGILGDAYLEHWMLFVRGIYLLHKDKISASDLEEADSLLKTFHDEIKDLCKYTDEDGIVHDVWLYHFNVHQLLHQAAYASDWGPAMDTSAFVFESNNGFLKNLVHGYSSVGTELSKSLQILESIRILKYKCLERKRQINSVLDESDDQNDCTGVRGAPVAAISDIVKGAFINYVTQQREIVLWGTFKCKRDRDWETALRNL